MARNLKGGSDWITILSGSQEPATVTFGDGKFSSQNAVIPFPFTNKPLT